MNALYSLVLPSAQRPSSSDSERACLAEQMLRAIPNRNFPTSRAIGDARHVYANAIRQHPETQLSVLCDVLEDSRALSPGDAGILRTAVCLQDGGRHRVREWPKPSGPDCELATAVAGQVRALVADAMKAAYAENEETFSLRIERTLDALALAELADGPHSDATTDALRKHVIALFMQSGRYADARDELWTLYDNGGSLQRGAQADALIAAHVNELLSPFVGEAEHRRRLLSITSDALLAAEPRHTPSLQRLLERISPATSRVLDIDGDDDWNAFVERIGGAFAAEYKERGRSKLNDARSGPTETRASAWSWLHRFKKLVLANVATQQAQAELPEHARRERLRDAAAAYATIIGHDDAKQQIRESMEAALEGRHFERVLMLEGVPGNGKSSLASYAARVMGKAERMLTINVAGMRDAKELAGWHSGYVAGEPSPLTRFLMSHGTGDVFFVLEEIDKASEDVQSIVAKLLDGNDGFVDHYFDLEPDLSRAHIIVTFNERAKLTAHLQNRALSAVKTKPLNAYTKERILREVLVPRVLKDHELSHRGDGTPRGLCDPQNLPFFDSAIEYILRRSRDETGARKLEADVRRVASNVVWRRRHGEAISRVVEADAMRAVEGAWASIQTFPSRTGFMAELAFLNAEERFAEGNLSFAFNVDAREWFVELSNEGGRLSLRAGATCVYDLEFGTQCVAPNSPRALRLAQQCFIKGETVSWNWDAAPTIRDALLGQLHSARGAPLECFIHMSTV